MTEEIKSRIIAAFVRLNGKEPTDQQIKDIYNALKECGLI